jgi:hypothetical protein
VARSNGKAHRRYRLHSQSSEVQEAARWRPVQRSVRPIALRDWIKTRKSCEFVLAKKHPPNGRCFSMTARSKPDANILLMPRLYPTSGDKRPNGGAHRRHRLHSTTRTLRQPGRWRPVQHDVRLSGGPAFDAKGYETALASPDDKQVPTPQPTQ